MSRKKTCATRSLILGLALLGGCASSAARGLPEPAPKALLMTPCTVPGSTETLRCGIYQAPEDRRVAGGRTVPLKVVVIPARNPAPGMTPIFHIAGGPGLPATDVAPFAAQSPEREHHDVVLIDQRGTGEGHRLDCPGPGTDEEMGSWFDSVYQAPYPGQCRELLAKRADLSLYTTPIAMRDYDEVRQALGYDKINLMGGSYGSRAALIYMKMFGDHVRSAVVSGLTPLEARMPLFHPIGAQRALERVFAECAADPTCRSAFPDPAGDFAKARALLRSAPVTVQMKHPETGEIMQVRFTEQRLLGAVRPMLYSLGLQRRLPLALSRAAKGDFSHFAPGAMFARNANQKIAAGMSLSVICSEDVARITPADIARYAQGTFLGPEFVTERIEACSHWPPGRLPADHFEPFTRDIPVLLVTGSHDPVTPQWMAETYARYLPKARHLILREAHSLPEGPCLRDITLQVFQTADVGQLDTSCVSALPVPAFAVPGA